MKTFVTTLLATIISFCAMSQTVWIADNRPTAPTGSHIFSSVAGAIGAASPGDIIHITPSQFNYGDWSVTVDSLTIFGIGYNPDKEQPSVSRAENITINNGVFGTRISGLRINNLQVGSAAGSSLGNVFIENCRINRIYANGQCCTATNLSNVIIRNCIIGRDYSGNDHTLTLQNTYANVTAVIIANNVIANSSSSSSGGYGSINVTDAIISNNLFIGADGTNDFAFNTVSTSTISNNIFYNTKPVTDGIGGSVNNSTFNNNISFSTSDAIDVSFPIGVSSNTGDSVYVDTDPDFVNVPVNEDWDFTYDPTPNGGSAAIGNGNDGGDIGLTGGSIPYSPTGTPLPVIKVLRLPELIQEGTDVDATIEAEGN